MIKYTDPHVRLKPKSEQDLIDDMIEKVWIREFTKYLEEAPFTHLTGKKEDKMKLKNAIEQYSKYSSVNLESKVSHPNIYIHMTPESDGGNMKITINARHNGRVEDMYRAVNEIKEMIATIC